jgi:uncharacterized protein
MLLDTSGLFALYSSADKNHSFAIRFYNAAQTRITTNYILAEYVALGLVRGLPRSGVLKVSSEILRDRSVEIIWIDESLHLRSVELLLSRTDKTYSLCDAVSFVLMRNRSISQSLTTDKHFEQEGFTRLLK